MLSAEGLLTAETGWFCAYAFLFAATTGFNPLFIPILFFTELHGAEWRALLVDNYSLVECVLLIGVGVVIFVYWMNGFWLVLLEKLQLLLNERTRIQPKTKESDGFNYSTLGKVCRNLLVNQVFVLAPCAVASAYLSANSAFGPKIFSGGMPSFRSRTLSFWTGVVVDEFSFYYGHRWLHENTYLYKKVHKIHHENTAPIGLCAAYCHPFEMFLSNVMPLLLGQLVSSPDVFTFFMWSIAIVMGTQTHHSGFRYPWTPWFDDQPDFHDFHHEKFSCNYGLLGWCDKLHGTDKLWVQQGLGRGLFGMQTKKKPE